MKKANPTIAITGANGFLGTNLTNYFAEQGYQVVGLVRNVKQHQKTAPKNVMYREYDITKPITAGTLDGVTFLVHAAYVKLSKTQPDAEVVNVKGAKNILAAARKQNVRRTVFVSTMSAHEDATSVYGKQKLAVEALFNTKADTILKSGLIIGNGGIVADMAKFMKSKHAVPLIGGGKQPLQIIAISDLVKVIATVLDKNINGTFVTATPNVYSYKEFYQALAKHLGVAVVYVPVPYGVIKAGFKMAAMLGLPLSVGEDNLEGLKMLRAMDSKPDLAALGMSLMSLEKALKNSGI